MTDYILGVNFRIKIIFTEFVRYCIQKSFYDNFSSEHIPLFPRRLCCYGHVWRGIGTCRRRSGRPRALSKNKQQQHFNKEIYIDAAPPTLLRGMIDQQYHHVCAYSMIRRKLKLLYPGGYCTEKDNSNPPPRWPVRICQYTTIRLKNQKKPRGQGISTHHQQVASSK